MIHWAEELHLNTDAAADDARGFLMGRVKPTLRQKWLEEAWAETDFGHFEHLLAGWAIWDPQAALDFALGTRNLDAICGVVESGTQ